MNRSVPRPDLGELMVNHRDFFPTEVNDLEESLALRPMPSGVVVGLANQARDLLGRCSWFAPQSRLMLDCVRLQARAAYGRAILDAAAPGETVAITLDEVIQVVRDERMDLGPVSEWADSLCAAIAARDTTTLAGMQGVPSDRLHRSRVQIDPYQYELAEALQAITIDPDRCLAAVARGREQWKQRKVAMKSAADIDAALFDAIEALVAAAGFDDALYRALVAHAKHWASGDQYLAARGWVALRHVALACIAHDRGVPVEIDSPYLPRVLVQHGLVEEHLRELALAAGEAFARERLEPQGYRRLEIARVPLSGFDFIYTHEDRVALIDTLAGDQLFDPVHAASGQIVEVGTRPYVELMISNMRRRTPQAADVIERALAANRVRYFEVRQAIEAADLPGAITSREFAFA